MFETVACVAAQVSDKAQKLAVDDGQTKLDYSSFWEAAGAMRSRIDSAASEPNLPVYVCLSRSAEMVVAFCAVLMAGRRCIPLDPAHPEAHNAALLHDGGRGLLIGSSATCAALGVGAVDTVNVDEMPTGTAPAHPAIAHDEIEFQLYTSGSTGTPKGVLISQGAMLRAVDGVSVRLGITAQARVMHFAAPAFDSATFEWIAALANGATLFIVPDHVREDPTLLGDYVATNRITHAVLPSALLPLLPLRDDYALEAIVVAGDVCPEDVLRRWADRYPTYNGYGPSECTVCTSVTRVTPDAPISISDALDCISLRVCDADGNDADYGEIWVGGDQVSLGYHGDALRSDAAFQTDADGVRWFRTGDWAEWDAGGHLLFAGRKDAQLKVRGNRVDLSQLDRVAAATPGVAQIYSGVRTTDSGEKRLFLFAASDAEPEKMAATILENIQRGLPGYYVPAHVVVLPSLPTNANDKIDRMALLALLTQESAVEDGLAALFAAQTDGRAPDESDNFFANGGNSIAVLRLLHSVSETFGVTIPLAAFQAQPTLGHLRRLVGAAADGEQPIKASTATPGKQYPLTPQQDAIWFLHQSHPASKAYLAEASIWFHGTFEAAQMEMALNDVFARHEIYRTVFGATDGKPYQQVLEEVQFTLPVLDYRHVAPEQRDEMLASAFGRELPDIADLSSSPPARFILIVFADDLHVLLHQEHHIIHDGWGGNVFTDDLVRSYRARVDADFDHNPQGVPHYLNFAERQADFLTSSDAEKQLTYWQGQLSDCPDGVALFGKKSTRIGFEGAAERQVFSAAEWDKISAGCRDLGITTFAYTSAILFLCLARHSGQDDLTIGSAFANRGWPNGQDVLGMLVNTVVLRQKLDGGQVMRDYLTAVQKMVQDAQANERYPFAKLVEDLNPERSGSNPFFNVLLGFHDTPLNAETPEGLTWTKDETVESATSKFDLDCLVIPRRGRFRDRDEVHFLWEYRSDIYNAAEIQLFLENFRQLFMSGFNDLDGAISQVPVVASDQMATLQDWGTGAALEFVQTPLVDTIADHACARPDAIAVTDSTGDLTYGALIEQAKALSRVLSDAGLLPGACVALELPRGNSLAVGYLATWMTGATAFVLDAELPAERRAYLLEVARPSLILGPDLDVKRVPGNAEATGDPDRAYIVFTSGSTGLPKGVEVSQASLLNLCHMHCALFGLSPETTGVSIAHPAFDAHIAELWPVLLAGGRVVSISDEERNDFGRLEAALGHHAVTHACLSTGLFEAAQGHLMTWPDSLRTLLTGGDRLGPVTRPDLPDLRLFNMYGPTETTVDAVYFEVTQDHCDAPPIGCPVPNATALVVDADNHQCPAGVEGELVIGGAGIAMGYLGQPDLTAERFVSGAEFGRDPSERFYRTGDFARWSLDGQLLFSGRRDDEVKIRGFRVNLNEITRLLMEDARVSQAAAAVKDGQLLGYVVPTGETQVLIAAGELKPQRLGRQLTGALRKALPTFMRPNSILVRDAFSLTAQGKVDRAALPGLVAVSTDHVSPDGATETQVAVIWSEFLERQDISATDSFFSIGGHSLLAIKILSRLSAQYGIALKLEDFFDNYTVRELSRLIDTLVALAAPQVASTDVVEEGEL